MYLHGQFRTNNAYVAGAAMALISFFAQDKKKHSNGKVLQAGSIGEAAGRRALQRSVFRFFLFFTQGFFLFLGGTKKEKKGVISSGDNHKKKLRLVRKMYLYNLKAI